jgi:hypothetical protein
MARWTAWKAQGSAPGCPRQSGTPSRWMSTDSRYAAFIEALGLQLRPGVAVDDIANILSALVDGLMLHTVGNPSPALVDHDRKRTVLGTAALALIYSFLEPAKDASGPDT